MSKFLEGFGALVIFILGIFLISLIRGFVLAKLWLWFVVSTFNVDPLTIVQALGISFTFSYLMGNLEKFKTNEEKEDKELTTTGVIVGKVIEGFVKSIVAAFVVLFLGWILTLFM